LVFLLDGRLSLTDAGAPLHAVASGLLDAARLELTQASAWMSMP
jgi:hypothetical protein